MGNNSQPAYRSWLRSSLHTISTCLIGTLPAQAFNAAQTTLPPASFTSHLSSPTLSSTITLSTAIDPSPLRALKPKGNQTLAQTPTLPGRDLLRPIPPSSAPLPTPEPKPLPAPEPLPKPTSPAPIPTPDLPEDFRIKVDRFEVRGSSVFNPAELDAVTKPFLKNPNLTLADLFKVRDAITNLYTEGCNQDTSQQSSEPTKPCYINSGAYIPPDQDLDPQGAVVVIQVLEGSLEAINVTGTRHLNPGYVSSRLALATAPPLNRNRLQNAIQLLRLDPLIYNVSAEIAASPRPGKSILNVKVEENLTFHSPILLNNGRSPSVGSFRRGIQLTQADLLGFGDGFSVGYTNTEGSNAIDLSYNLPLSPHNTTLSLSYGSTRSHVIEPPFDVLGIDSKSRYYEVTLRQPIVQTLNQDFSLSFTFSRRESETSLSFNNIGPFPLSPGADARGRTRISAVRFSQEYTQRSDRAVLAFRSQFSLGLDLFNATLNPAPPDSKFLAWRGQAQWVRVLGPDAAIFIRGDVQLADRPLVSIEQFGNGGIDSVRGYRQDTLLTDSGIFASTEIRIPILRIPKLQGVLQLTPFIEFGKGWNRGERPDPNPDHLLSGGLGLRWRMGDRFEARFDWGIPFITDRTLQEQNLYFSVLWNPF